MEAGTWYYVEFYVSLVEGACGLEELGAYFSVTSPYIDAYTTLGVEPQIVSSDGFITDETGWIRISGCYLAEEGEMYMTIGNFNNDVASPYDPDCFMQFSYYYLDDVLVTIGDPGAQEIPLDLGGPVIACATYEIDPDHEGPIFEWSDGSNGPTLTVDESGV
jgi:hypothetical protein